MLVMILAFAIVGIASVLVFYKAARDLTRSEYDTHCTDLAGTVARSLDITQVKNVKEAVMTTYRSLDPSARMLSEQEGEDGYNEYLSHYHPVTSMHEFISLRNKLRRSQDVAHVECLYLIYPDQESDRLVYLVDASYEDVWDPGTLEVLYDTDFKVKGDIRSGFGSLISKEDNGKHILTTAVPLVDNMDQVVAYVGLDYSIQNTLDTQRKYMFLTLLFIALLSGIAAYLMIRLVDRSLVRPINALTKAAAHYHADDSGKATHQFADLNIHTGDEVETLADSMSKMEEDINDHIRTLLSVRNQLKDTQGYAEEMARDANKDYLTGVRNRRAYETEIGKLNCDDENERFGLAVIDMNDLKLINDHFGHECGDESIISLCNTICEVFAHSPVFRYGGDEFVVVLRNHDLEHIVPLAAQFRSKLTVLCNSIETKPWLRFGAAIGYAIFDPRIDHDTDSVFERADKAMYDDKVRGKAGH